MLKNIQFEYGREVLAAPLFFLVATLPLWKSSLTFDPTYSLAWLLLAVALAVGVVGQIWSVHPGRFTLLLALFLTSMGLLHLSEKPMAFADASQWFVIILVASLDMHSLKREFGNVVTAMVALSWLLIVGTLLTSWVITWIETGSLSHKDTYAVGSVLTHRNLALEYTALLSVWWGLQMRKWPLRLILALITLGLTFLFQARAATLVAGLFVLYVFPWHIKSIRYAAITIAAAFVLFNGIGLFYLWSQGALGYANYIAGLSDQLKAMDVYYNLQYAGSSQERWAIWKWTWSELNASGHGLGSWRRNAQGYLELPNYDCYTIIRRAHNDLLQVTYEQGLVGLVVLFFLLVYRTRGRRLILFLPLLLVAFPLERAPFLFPLFWLIQPKEISWVSVSKMHVSFPVSVVLSVVLAGCFALVHTAHRTYGSWVQDISQVREGSKWEQMAVDQVPYDFMLNHREKYEVMQALSVGKTDRAIEQAVRLYERDPNMYVNYKLVSTLLQDKRGITVVSKRPFPCEKQQE